MTAPNEMPVRSLLCLRGTPEAPRIPGATRHPRNLIDRLAQRLDGARVVIVCQKDQKLSQGIAFCLRSEGIETDLTLYNALYRCARDGGDEGHDWPAGRSA